MFVPELQAGDDLVVRDLDPERAVRALDRVDLQRRSPRPGRVYDSTIPANSAPEAAAPVMLVGPVGAEPGDLDSAGKALRAT